MSHGRDQILVRDNDGNVYRSLNWIALPDNFYFVTRDKEGFSVYDKRGDLLSHFWNVRRLPELY